MSPKRQEQLSDVAVPVVRPIATLPAVERELEEQVRTLLLDPAFKSGLEVEPVPGIWEAPKEPVIYQTENGSWLFGEHSKDLAALELGGAIAAPREQIQRLHALADAGVDCDVVGIAHELPLAWEPGQRLVPDAPKGRRQRQALQAFARGIGQASRATAKTAGAAAEATAVATGVLALGALGTAAAGAAVVAGAAGVVPGALLSLDPIVFGGVEYAGRVKWVELARWNWE